MNSQNTKLIIASDFLKLIAAEEPFRLNDPPRIVRGLVDIDGTKVRGEHLSVRRTTFSDGVRVHKFSGEKQTVRFEECNFLGYLDLSGNQLNTLSLNHCELDSLAVHRTTAGKVWLTKVKVNGTLGIAGLTVTEGMEIDEVEYKSLGLTDHTGDVAAIKVVRTDDLVAATQFRLLGVPVIVSTEKVRELLGREGPAALLRAS
ncbi:MAG TPA: hypothetical protein VJJ47_02780 [Candidatus Paceibacterota bacterium]